MGIIPFLIILKQNPATQSSKASERLRLKADAGFQWFHLSKQTAEFMLKNHNC
jgi:hypothetical protein